MIPFEELVASLERYKLRKLAAAGAPVSPAGKATSGKQAQEVGRPQATADLRIDELLAE